MQGTSLAGGEYSAGHVHHANILQGTHSRNTQEYAAGRVHHRSRVLRMPVAGVGCRTGTRCRAPPSQEAGHLRRRNALHGARDNRARGGATLM